MSSIYQGLPPATYFNGVSRRWNGTGVVVHLLPDDIDSNFQVLLADLNSVICRVIIGMPDPGLSASENDNDAMKQLWVEASLDPHVVDLFACLLANDFTTTIICVAAPQSWMLEPTSSLSGDLLSTYSRYVCGCVAWLHSILSDSAFSLLRYVDVYDRPDRPEHYVSPQNIAALTTRLNTSLAEYPYLKVIGPGLSQTVSLHATSEPYTDAYVNRMGSLAMFSCHAEINEADSNISIPEILDGCEVETIVQRDLLARCLEKNIASQRSVGWNKERIVTSWGKHPLLTNISMSKSDAERYGIAASRAFCAILSKGFSAACFHRLISPDHQPALYEFDSNQTTLIRTIWGVFFARLGSALPGTGQVYVSEEMSSGDNTLKCMVLAPRGDTFAILLCRPETPDTLSGNLRLIIRNPLWSDRYKVTSMTLESLTTQDLSNITYTTKIARGLATLVLSQVPYASSVILLTGQVSLNPPLDPPPPPPTEPNDEDQDSLMETIIQVPVHYGTPSRSAPPVNGSFYYDTQDQVAKVYISNEWVDVNMLV